jgi:phosphoserine phosphatase
MKREIRLVIFDLDGTLTPVDSLWRYLHDALGTWDRGKVAAQRYWRGEMSYKEWAEADAGCWAGVPLGRIGYYLSQIPYRKGARELFEELRRRKVKTAILSAGLSLLADKAAAELHADLVVSNELQTSDGCLTGEIAVKVSVKEKQQIIAEIANQADVSLDETALVGDRANDLPEPRCFKIAFKPKEDAARQIADCVVEDDDLSRILRYLELSA